MALSKNTRPGTVTRYFFGISGAFDFTYKSANNGPFYAPHWHRGAKIADFCWLLSRHEYTAWYVAGQNHTLVCQGCELCILAFILRPWKEVLWINRLHVCFQTLGFSLQLPALFFLFNECWYGHLRMAVWGREGSEGRGIRLNAKSLCPVMPAFYLKAKEVK